MLQSIRQFLASVSSNPAGDAFSHSDPRWAAAALLFHVIAVDGVVSDSERERLRTILASRYALTPAETTELMREAEAADLEAVDLYRFTSVIVAAYDQSQRKEVIAAMWDLAYVDGHMDEFEENVLWRVSELLGISARDRIELKRIAERKQD